MQTRATTRSPRRRVNSVRVVPQPESGGVVARVMDMSTGSDARMIDASTQTQPRKRRRRTKRKTSNAAFQVYQPANLRAGQLVGRDDY